MKNLRINKRIISLMFTGIVLTTFCGCSKKQKESGQENLIGHMNITDPDDISPKDFIYYNVGNHKEIGISEQDELLEKCKQNGISTGIIIDSDAKIEYEIYEDVEFTKSIIEKSDIELPVYFNIKNIINNDNLNMSEKSNLITEYITLTEQNNIYVGLYGTSTDLAHLNQYGTPITQYDCFVVEDGITEYQGNSSIIQDKKGNIKSIYHSNENNDNLAELIKNNNQNNKDNLRQNAFYEVEENCNIEKIAIQYNLSVNDILKFNDIAKDKIKPGTILRIPNQVQKETKLVFPELTRQDHAIYKGIDISHYQGDANKIDFKRLSKHIDFAILKISEQENNDFRIINEDPCFNSYYEECKKNDIDMGGYFVTHATTVNEAKLEAKLIADKVKDLDITFPIFIDYENTKDTVYEKEFNEIQINNQFEEMMKEYKYQFEEAGLRFGIYTNLSTYSEMVDMVGLDTLNNYEIWLSKPNEYTDIQAIIDNGPICKTDDGRYLFSCDIYQASWTINIPGIPEKVDGNLCYADYKKPQQTIELPPEKTFKTKQYDRKDTKRTMKKVGKIGGTASLMLLSIYTIRHKKRLKRKLKKLIIGIKRTRKEYKNSIQQENQKVLVKTQKAL